MNLADARNAKGWSQEELAGRLGLKSKSYICEIEGGAAKPSLRVAIGIYRELGVRTAPIADLTDREIAILEKTSKARAA
jgi:transcriptional regulator with XRE-family HTH domain